jgi:hypothetical protein
MLTVNIILYVVWLLYYLNNNDIIKIKKGGYIKKIIINNSRLYSNWVKIRKNQIINLKYKNIYPEKNKFVIKWSISKKGRAKKDFFILFI